MQARGDYIAGRFAAPVGSPFCSHDPARGGEVVLETAGSAERAREAASAAAEAGRAWAALSLPERLEILEGFRQALDARRAGLAEAIRLEMGKIQREAEAEAASLVSRFALAQAQVRRDLRGGAVAGHPAERVRYRPHGVVGVLGPYNFPLHLCHAHVLPALMLGNAVVMKPSEVTPLCGQRYAEAAHEAGLPAGVLNVVQGRGDVGAALVQAPEVRGLAFTGSYETGRRIAEAALDRPELLLALEMGGKNACVVLEDADVRQAVHEIVISGMLTTGQRCTCTDRVLVHRSRVDEVIEAVCRVISSLRFGDPEDPSSFAGPLATEAARERLLRAIDRAREGGASVVLGGGPRDGGAFVDPSVHRLPDGVHAIEGYTDVELFGPDLCFEVIDDDTEAIETLNASPFGFACGVFTRDEERFDRYRRELDVGVLNRNRGTNKASPRLPFGGVKRSGNFRPAGAWAPRNMVFPVAEIDNEATAFEAHPQLLPHLPGEDLDRLEARHTSEETAEAGRSLLDTPRVLKVARPEGGRLPASERLHERYYGGDRFQRGEKKPPVFDHLRSHGPWMVSVDDEPLAVLDGMSQTATLAAGFAPDHVVEAYVEGAFGDTALANADTTLPDHPHAAAFAEALRERAPGLPTVSFVNSGAEANEKAYALCLARAPEGARKLLAFEGSFHGRTLLALYASYNPTKRLPFQIAGYEVDFAPAPVVDGPDECDPAEPPEWAAVWGAGDAAAARERWGDAQDDGLRREVEALGQVADRLSSGEHFAVVVEPMQSEGGDRYLSARFHRALRLLTRARSVSLVVDEVQCGFGLGGTFLWHQRFGYVDAQGQPDTPDCVCFAKRAQLGVCMSRYEDPEPTHAFAASLVRGRLHAQGVGDGSDARRVEALVRPRLARLAARWGHRISSPRAQGYAVAFDLASGAELAAYLGQRFWRGAVVFGAGQRTVRYRLSSSYDERAVDLLFESMQRSLAWLEAHPGQTPPRWEDLEAQPADERWDPPYRLRVADPSEADAALPAILELEARTYEPARRDSEAQLRKAFAPGGVAVLAEVEEGGKTRLIGSALGTPLENVAGVPGPDRDPFLGRDDTLYSLAVTVDPEWRGHGVGRALKRAQLERARDMRRDDGAPRYRHASGRNRVPDASSMARLNDSLGAYTVARLEGQYEGGGVARYYRQPLGRFEPEPARAEAASEEPRRIDLASGLVRPLAEPPASLRELWEAGALFGPTVTKVTLLNYLTPAAVRAAEWIGALTPELPHAYPCSSRDETVDKAVRALRWHRPDAATALSFEGAYVGHTTACARSITDPSTHRQGEPYFDWPRLPHPAEAGVEASLQALRAAIDAAGGPDRVFGVFVEPVQERTGRVIPQAFWGGLDALRRDTGVPIVTVETACAYYRCGLGAFATSGLDFAPDLMIWWTGGQLGFVHVTAPYRVDKPMTLVSTWDGDELSLIQMHHQLRAARTVDVRAASQALDRALRALGDVPVRGLGLYRVAAAGERAEELAGRLDAAGISVGRLPGGHLAIAPRLDRAMEDAAALEAALRGGP